MPRYYSFNFSAKIPFLILGFVFVQTSIAHAQFYPFAVRNKATSVDPGFPLTFTDNGTFEVPANCSSLNIQMWGGGGGSGGRMTVGGGLLGGAGGQGGYVSNNALSVTPGATLQVYVGKGGTKGTGGGSTASSPRAGGAGGVGFTNGGAGGTGQASAGVHIAGGGGGGGSSALVQSGTPIIVAGGGGGGGGSRQNRSTCDGYGGVASGGTGGVGETCSIQAQFCPLTTSAPTDGHGTNGGDGVVPANNGGSGGGGGGAGYAGGQGGKGSNGYSTDASGGNAGTSYNGTFSTDTSFGNGGIAGTSTDSNTDGQQGRVVILGCN